MAGKSLDQLEDVVWGEPTFDSHLVTTCHRLRNKPIDEFSTEDLRIMIGQEISLPHLIPLAVGILEREPLAEGDFCPGALLANVIKAEKWLIDNPEWLARVVQVTERAVAGLVEEFDQELRQEFTEFLMRVRG